MKIAKPGLENLLLNINGDKIIGGFYYSGIPHAPTFILAHGIPGLEKMTMFAYEFQKRGWNCLYFHYRGCWGSSGNYNILNHQEDLHEVYNWVKNKNFVDSNRIGLIGSSLGGYNILRAVNSTDQYFSYIALCPLIDINECELSHDEVGSFADYLLGVDKVGLYKQWGQLPSVLEFSEQLKQKNILLLTGDRDEIFPPEHYIKLSKICSNIHWQRHEEADHIFSGQQYWLVEKSIEWLEQFMDGED
ncbi:prolyl oligopeptidase family serine peptidase [Bacteriovoracaceae bacterium]|nr:prolyl oligopeptidase family serine peptidase [Bacteriovoracaceae bacterium]